MTPAALTRSDAKLTDMAEEYARVRSDNFSGFEKKTDSPRLTRTDVN